jgi:hypothetical protein
MIRNTPTILAEMNNKMRSPGITVTSELPFIRG